jgi:2'-hydroxyisoflavone reductase
MKLLVLGGTSFLGRHFVDAALAGDHDIATFTRGKTNPEAFSQDTVERLRGDRDGGLDSLRGRAWDAVLDTSGYLPRVVRASAELLAGAGASAAHYTFVSSESVYAPTVDTPVAEDGPLLEPPPDGVEEIMEHYGGLKVACERMVREAFGERALVVRPGLIVGPHDPTNRFTYWVRRMHDAAGGEEILAPAPPERQVQFIDARDLAEWLLRMIEAGASGTYNADGPDRVFTMGETLTACAAAAERSPRVVWADERFLLDQKVEPWMGLPLWIPEDDPDGFGPFDNRAAVGAGLAFRAVRDTARDTLAWDLARPTSGPVREDGEWAGIPPEREAEVLAAWRAGHPGP